MHSTSSALVVDRTLAGLRRAGVPESIITRIAIEKREVIKTEQHVRSLIRQHVGDEDAQKYVDEIVKHLEPLKPRGMIVRHALDKERRVYGMFAALSFDEGRTWPVRKLLTPGGKPRVVDCYGCV